MKGKCLRDCWDSTGTRRYFPYHTYDVDPDSQEAKFFDFDGSTRPSSADPRELNYRKVSGGCGTTEPPK